MAWTTISIATLGCKTLTAVGSITAGTNSLVLASNPGFQIGDQIIVAVGGEAGVGVRGTKGVGGNWPTPSYATTAALLAATPAEFTRAWAEDTGKVYFRGASSWTDLSAVADLYYVNMAVPTALVAEITNVSGNTLTLDTTANVTATNANVYFDNLPILSAAWGDGGTHTDPKIKWTIPAATYALSDRLTISFRTDWIISGAGNTQSKFLSPDGVPSVYLHCPGGTRVLLRDFGIIGNNGANGFGVIDLGATSQAGFALGVWFQACSDCVAIRLRADDIFQKAVGCDNGQNNWAYNCHSVRSEANYQYIQWDFQWADTYGGGIVDCSVDSPHLVGGAEVFDARRCSIIRFTGRNATMSSNSAGASLFDAPNITIEASSQLNTSSFSEFNPIITFNQNIDISSGRPSNPDAAVGAIVRNPTIVQTGRIDGDKTSLIAITINTANDNIRIVGTFPDSSNPKGLISAPDYQAGDLLGGFSGMAVRSSGTGIRVSGIRMAGAADYGGGHGNVHTEGGSIDIARSVMDHAATGTASPLLESGTQTNAAWVASH